MSPRVQTNSAPIMHDRKLAVQTMSTTTFIERFVEGIEFVKSRWRLILAPVAIIAPIAFIAVKSSPVRYVATSVILLRSPLSSGIVSSQTPQQNAIDQVKALEAWLKSDLIIEQYLPKLSSEPLPADPFKFAAMIKETRSALKLSLVNNSVIEVQLEGSTRLGLGRKLEIVLTHLMEGLLRPGSAGVLSGGQLILTDRLEAWQKTQAEIADVIRSVGIEPTNAILKQLGSLDQSPQTAPASSVSKTPAPSEQEPGSINSLQTALASNPVARTRLLDLRLRSDAGRAAYEAAKSSFPTDSRYVGVFDSPERLTVVGRPRDPLVGENPATKYGVAAIFLSLVAGLSLAWLADLLAPRLRSKKQFEELIGLPVIARLPTAVATVTQDA